MDIQDKKETNGTLVIPNHNHNKQAITQKDPKDGAKGLGVILAPDGNTKDQLNKLLTKVKTWSTKISRGYISLFAADVAL